jgi:hypothetical protein
MSGKSARLPTEVPPQEQKRGDEQQERRDARDGDESKPPQSPAPRRDFDQAPREARDRHLLRGVEVGLELRHGPVALGRIAPQRAQGDLLGLQRDGRAQLPRRLRIADLARARHDEGVVAFERRMSGQHLVEHGPERVDIDARLPAPATDLLGGHVVRRREGGRGPGEREATRHDLVRHPEIDQANRAVVAKEHVSRLQVVVHDLSTVQVLHGLAHAPHDAQRLRLREPAPLADAGCERRPSNVLGHDVGSAPVGRERDESQDVRVLELAADLRFALEHGPAAKAARELRQRNLHRHELPIVVEVRGLEDRGHAAAPDLLEQEESPFEGLARSDFRRGRHGLGRCASRAPAADRAFVAMAALK